MQGKRRTPAPQPEITPGLVYCPRCGTGWSELAVVRNAERNARRDIEDACQAVGLPRDSALWVLLDVMEKRGRAAAYADVISGVQKQATITASKVR